MFNHAGQQKHFETERWQVVVQKQGALDEKVWQKVEEVAHQEELADASELFP